MAALRTHSPHRLRRVRLTTQVQTLQAELGLLVDADRQKQERLAKLQTQLNTARGGSSGRLGSGSK